MSSCFFADARFEVGVGMGIVVCIKILECNLCLGILWEIDEIQGYQGLVFLSVGDFLQCTVRWVLNLQNFGDLEE